MQGCGNCLKTRPLKNGDKFARICTEFNDIIFVFSFNCSCNYGRWSPADSNPFGICQRICDLHPENCGHCTEPLQCDEWKTFWEHIEQEWADNEKKQLYYDPDPRGCEFCDDLYNCEDCPQRAEQENACDYIGDECIDSACRRDGCIGCEVIAPPPKEELMEVS